MVYCERCGKPLDNDEDFYCEECVEIMAEEEGWGECCDDFDIDPEELQEMQEFVEDLMNNLDRYTNQK